MAKILLFLLLTILSFIAFVYNVVMCLLGNYLYLIGIIACVILGPLCVILLVESLRSKS